MTLRQKLIRNRQLRIKQYEQLWLHYWKIKDYPKQQALIKHLTWCKTNINR